MNKTIIFIELPVNIFDKDVADSIMGKTFNDLNEVSEFLDYIHYEHYELSNFMTMLNFAESIANSWITYIYLK